jgi:HPt (histidine-containing phosphotransfer) domain-containing protein
MDDFIIKPFDAASLVRSILRHVTPRAGPAASEPTPAVPGVVTAMVPVVVTLAGPGMVPVTVAAPGSPAWLEIDGIDSADARERLMDDFGLFRSMLKRLLDECGDQAAADLAGTPEVRERFTARMHKLSGSAGLLGAARLHQLASQAEAAGRAGDLEQVAVLATRVSTELNSLRRAAADALTETSRHTPQHSAAHPPASKARGAQADQAAQAAQGAQGAQADPSTGTPIDPQELAALLDHLRQHKMSAVDHFNTLLPQLRGVLGAPTCELMADHIEHLRFDAAAGLLEAAPA